MEKLTDKLISNSYRLIAQLQAEVRQIEGRGDAETMEDRTRKQNLLAALGNLETILPYLDSTGALLK